MSDCEHLHSRECTGVGSNVRQKVRLVVREMFPDHNSNQKGLK